VTTVTQLSHKLWHISLPFQGEHGVLGCYVFAGSDQLVLIDPGPQTTAAALIEGLEELGFQAKDVTHILATHIHLDHAGGAGTLLQQMPHATVLTHSKGAPHLVDPAKLLTSATRIYGDRMNELWGTVEPVPEDQVQAIDHGDVLTLADRRLEVHYAPGHASHHVIFFDVHSGEMFTGDAAGVRLPGINYNRPPTPPPDLDLEVWTHTITMMKQLHPDVLYLAHFGPSKEPVAHLDQLRERLYSWGELVLQAMREGKDEAQITEYLIASTQPELERLTDDPTMVRRYDLATNYPMTVQGYMRYWRKQGKAS